MACLVPFNNSNLDIIFYVLRPTTVFVDELVDALKQLSSCTESLGCIHSAIFRSIHGNMIIWHGAWMKRSDENKDLLNETLLSALANNVSNMAILIDQGFFEAYAGESKDGTQAAKFFMGDIISMNAAILTKGDEIKENNISYACLAIFKSYFLKMEGATAGVCLKCQSRRTVMCLFVWKSLHSCYSWILNVDHRRTVLPYLDGLPLDLKYDVFRVVHVSSENALNLQFCPPHQMLENGLDSKGHQVM